MGRSKKKKRVKEDSLDAFCRKRDRAIERVIAVWEKGEAVDDDELNRALDALTVAHVALTFEWASGPLKW
jgi:hypothetical protein